LSGKPHSASGQHTIAGGESLTCRSEQSTLGRSQGAFGPPSVSTPAQENASPVISNSGEASRFGHDFSRIPLFAQHKETLPTAAQNQFKTKGSAGGLAGHTLNVTFSVSDTPAKSLQAIQTFKGTRRIDGLKVGKYTLQDGGKTWDAFVDGGKNSPYAENTGAPVHPSQPYFLNLGEVMTQVDFNKAKGTGTIRIDDKPDAVESHDEAHFETAIVAVDYNDTKKDKILKAFKWGWTDKGTKSAVSKDKEKVIAGKPSGISVSGSVSSEFKDIVKHDYPKYDIA
jgi:hypothetical protein